MLLFRKLYYFKVLRTISAGDVGNDLKLCSISVLNHVCANDKQNLMNIRLIELTGEANCRFDFYSIDLESYKALYYGSREGTSDFRPRTSDFRFRTSDFRFRTSDFVLVYYC